MSHYSCNIISTDILKKVFPARRTKSLGANNIYRVQTLDTNNLFSLLVGTQKIKPLWYRSDIHKVQTLDTNNLLSLLVRSQNIKPLWTNIIRRCATPKHMRSR